MLSASLGTMDQMRALVHRVLAILSQPQAVPVTNCACAPGAIGYNGSFCFFISCTSSSSCYHVSVGAYLFSANFSTEVGALSSRIECRTICNSYAKCLSYVWNVQSLSCYLGRCLPGTSSTCSTFSNPLPEFHGGTWYFGYEKATYTVQNELSLEI